MEKRPRGRKRKIAAHFVLGSADVFRAQLTVAWPTMRDQILAAQTAVEVWEIVKSGRGIISNVDFEFSERIFEILNDPRFPQVRMKSQIQFLADSLAGCGFVKARRAREICAEERAKVRHTIVRREFYIECTCGYSGPALNGACKECGTMTLSEELQRAEDNDY